MHSSITVEEVNTDVLSAKTLALVSEFALILYRHNGTIIDVYNDDVIFDVFINVRYVNHPRLLQICRDIRAELSGALALQKKPTSLAHERR